MAIGDVRASGGLERQLESGRATAIRGQQAGQLGEAVTKLVQAGMGYLESETRIDALYRDRAMRSTRLDLETQFVNWQRERAEEFATLSRDRSTEPLGMTRDYSSALERQGQAFLNSVPEEFREEFSAKVERDRSNRLASSYLAELEAMDRVDNTRLGETLNTIASAVRTGAADLEMGQEQWEDMVVNSGLSEEDKYDLIMNGRQTLQAQAFSHEAERAASGYGERQGFDGSGSDVAASGLTSAQRGVLNAIAAVEAPGYNVWNGGTTFDSYAQHPAAGQAAPGESTAAGRYQFTLGTWRDTARSYYNTYGVVVPDFSPEWQDRLALHLAEKTFNQRNGQGLTFRQVLESGDPAQLALLRRAIGNPSDPDNPNSVVWQGWANYSFTGGDREADAKFIALMTGEQGYAGGGTGPAEGPNPWTDGRFADLDLATRESLANSASTAMANAARDAASQMQNQIAAFNRQMFELGYNGATLADLEQQRNNPNWSVEAEQQFRAGMAANEAKKIEQASIQEIITTGQPISNDQMEAYDEWFGQVGRQGLAAGDDEQLARLANAVTQTGRLPNGLAPYVLEALSDPEASVKVAELFSSLNRGTPGLLLGAGFKPADVVPLERYAAIAAIHSPEDTRRLYQEWVEGVASQGPATAQSRNEGERVWREEGITDKIITMLSLETQGRLGRIWYGSPAISTESRRVFENEMFAHFRVGWDIYRNEEDATAYAAAAASRDWGVSYAQAVSEVDASVSEAQPRFMKYPPENFYPAGAESFSYIYDEAFDQLQAQAGPLVEINRGTVQFVPDRQTSVDVAAGDLPTYTVVGETTRGEVVVLSGRVGGEALAQVGVTLTNTKMEHDANTAEFHSLQETYVGLIEEFTDRQLDTGQPPTQEELEVVSELWGRIRELNTNGLTDGWLSAGDSLVAAGERDLVRDHLQASQEYLAESTQEIERTTDLTSSFAAEIIAYSQDFLGGRALTTPRTLTELQDMQEESGLPEDVWAAQMVLRSLPAGNSFLFALASPTVSTYASPIIPPAWERAAEEFTSRYGASVQAIARAAQLSGEPVTAKEIHQQAIYELAVGWAGMPPVTARLLARQIQ